MEQSGPARHSSGIYDANYSSQQSFSSGAQLREHAEKPAGAATTAGGAPIAAMGAAAEWHDQPDASPQQEQPKVPFYKKRWFIITSIVNALLGIALLFIILYPVIRAIVQLVVKRTQISIERAVIMNANNETFDLHLQGNVTHTGIFSATIRFNEDVEIFWLKDPENDSTGVKIGHTGPLDELHAHKKRAKIDQLQHFTIDDQEAFIEFTRAMITQPTFSWRLSSNNLRVQALKFPVSNGISFNKQVDLLGINSFSGKVVLLDFQLPSDNPAGGLDFVALTELNNESPFALQLGTTIFDLVYDGVRLGSGMSTNTVIDAGLNNITLRGVLEPVTNPDDLVKVSRLFTNYLNGETSPVIAVGRSTLQDDGSTIQWLSEGLQALQLNVPFKAFIPIDPIRTIDIGDMGLNFTPETAWAPGVASNTIRASLQLPFGFNLSIGQIQNDFNIVRDGAPVAGLSTPLGASSSSITVLGETNTQGTIDIVIADTTLTCPDPQHEIFSAFNANLTSSDIAEFRLVGTSRAIANMSIGQITLDGIKVNVSTHLLGLQGLSGRTTIESVDVAGGTADQINLNINVTIQNPSNLHLSTGDLTLQLFRDGVALGTALLPNLNLTMGNNSVSATSAFNPNDSPQGLQTLNDFVGQRDVDLVIAGFEGSTEVASLAEAFNTLEIGVTLPGMSTSLLESAALTVLPTTGRENNISHVTVSLNNPFSAPLRISRISSTVTSHGISLGSIETDTNFEAPPHAVTESPNLELNMNFDPAALFTVTRALAVEAGLDPAPLDGIVQLGGIEYLSTTGQPPVRRQSSNVFDGFDLPTFVRTAFQKLQSDVELTTEVFIGDYRTTLQYTQLGVPTATDDTLNLILPILAQPIVEKIVGGAGLGIDTVLITDPQQESFDTHLTGNINNAGPFNAQISFPSGLNVAWQGRTFGNIRMAPVEVIGDVGASLDTGSTFNVMDVGALTDFTRVLLTEESFDWEISGENLTVSALGIEVPGILFPAKKVNLKGFNGLKDGVQIKTFDLPSNDPAGGIHLTIETSVINPSDVGIEMSSIGFNTFSGESMIAPVRSDGGVTLAPRSTSDLSLVGRLVPQESSAGLSEVSKIFNNFVAGKSSDVAVQGASAGSGEVTWLNEGIKSLRVNTILPHQGPQNIIKSIALNEMDLRFTEATAYRPSTSSSSTDAAFTLPFGFPLNIKALEQTITLGYEGTSFAELSIPKGPSATDVENRVIHITFENVPMAAFDNAHATYERFLAATTIGSTQTVRLSGTANADADTAVGLLALAGISFSVDSTIEGLQGLNTRPVTVSNLDVSQGFSDYLLIKVDSTLYNPSNLTIGTGDVAFSLQFQDKNLGSANIHDMIITPGAMTPAIDVHFSPQGDAVSAGRTMLQNYLQGINIDTVIQGSTGSTNIQSLKQALSQIHLAPVTIPALNQTLIKSASLTFPIDIVDTGIATTSFTLANPFSASINLHRVGAVASFRGITLGTIPNIDTSAHPIRADGHSEVTSPGLPLKYNLDPVATISLLRAASQENGVSLGPLDAMFQFVLDNPDFKPPVKTTVDTSKPTCVSGNQFDAAGAILKSLAGLRVDLAADTGVKLDEYATDLTFEQKSVPAIIDETALYLIGAVAGPVAQHLVDGSELAFSAADISNISNDGFDLSLKGSLTNVGPLDALIEFTEPVTVTWEGKQIAEITLSPICASANSGVPDYETTAHLTITNQEDFTEYATFLLHNEEFSWVISTDKLRLTALGTIFENVSLTKTVSFKAFNNLPGVAISNFQLPSDDLEGGIHIETDVSIPSPAQIGIGLGHVTFDSYFQGVLVGPLSADDLNLKPNAVAEAHLGGRIVPQSGENLETIGVLFSEFLAGNNITLETRGSSVQPPGANGPVTWLSTAFQTVSLQVVLPGKKFDVIQAIALNDLKVVVENQEQAFSPPASSQNTVAQYANPFGFSLQVIEAGQSLILNSHGTDIAQLDLPRAAANGGVSTGNTVDLVIQFENQPLKSLNNAAFAQMFAGVTLQAELELTLKGSADVTARTAIGDVPITGIPIDVNTSLKGINSFGGSATLDDVKVAGSGGAGGSEYILSPLKTTLRNPSNISLNTVDVSLPVVYEGTKIGRAVISEFQLVPGDNLIETEFHYQPDKANDTVAQSFLTRFIQSGDTLPLHIDGDDQSTPFGSLSPALDGLVLNAPLTGLNHPDIITGIHIVITLDTLVTDLVTVEFTVRNPLDTPMVIEYVQSDGSIDGLVYAAFGVGFDGGFEIPAGEERVSPEIPNVLLTQGALASLEIIPLGFLDIDAANTVRIGGAGGYQIPWLQLSQKRVPAVYDLVLSLALTNSRMSLDALINKAKDYINELHNSSSSSLPASTATLSISASASTTDAATTTADDATATTTAVAEASTTESAEPEPSSPAPTTSSEEAAESTPTPVSSEVVEEGAASATVVDDDEVTSESA